MYKQLKNGETFENPRAFLYRTANNFILKRFREIKSNYENLANIEENNEADLIKHTLSVEENYDYQEFLKLLDTLLNDNEKVIFNKRFVQEMKIKDIAEQLNISEPACAMKISRLRNKITNNLSEFKI